MRTASAILFTAFAGLLLACGNPFAKVREAQDRVVYLNDLKQIAASMHNYHSDHGLMPPDANALIAESPELQGSTAATRLMSDEIQMVWGFKLGDQTEFGTSGVVMGWSYAPQLNGNVGVMMADGTVVLMDPDEFAAKPKAALKKSKPPEPKTAPTRPAPKKGR